MIQSLSDPRKDKDYPSNLFESFGLVIADECHHLAARQFCRSIAKYPFKYTLGLSATPDRADGLQRVFKHYLGDIVYKDAEIQQSEEDIKLEHIPNSKVELYIYNNTDHNYSKEALNYQKKPNIVTMKSNVANCLKRTKFLLSFLPRLIEEGRTILILSCRRNHISDMETLINDMAIPNCSVGLYVGGMKQSNLDTSATKRIIIATYDMAEEAFDCKTLNTLIFGTPHKNIKQAVGRILREEKKKRKLIPLIIDLQDVFSSFNSWNKLREKYYKTEEYPMKLFNVIDKPDLNFKPIVSFIKDVSNKKTTKTKGSKETKRKKSSFIIDMDDEVVVEGDGDGDGDDDGDGDGDDNDNDEEEDNREILDF
jgi:superfamily II DNA or RNA helicase